ncbi:hypothetical protein ABPG75_007604 [Micractinium tetrahymenae]
MRTCLGARPFLGGTTQPHLCRPAAVGQQRRPRLQVAAALQDPWATLGVPRDASEKDIKKAHRKLVKQHHPDVKSNDPMANARFIRIQEAYELIMGKRSGKDLEGVPGNRSSWSFHDWYWSFSTKRRAKARGMSFAGAATGAEPAPDREQWRAQMAGLRQKAAAKRGRWRPAAQEAAAAATGQQEGGGSTQQQPKAPSNTAGAAAAAAAQPEPAEPLRHEAAPAEQAGSQQQQHAAGSAANAASHTSSEAGPAHAADGAAPKADSPLHAFASSGASHRLRLQQLLEHATGLVHSVQRSAADTAAAHVELREHATATALRHLSSRLAGWEQLSSLLGEQHAAAGQHAGHAEAGNAVPADSHLHHRFATSWRQHQHPRHANSATADAGPAAAAAEAHQAEREQQAQQAQQDFQQGLFRRAAHARKFADRQEVEGRLSGQLAGLRRRATVKHEVSSNC